MRDSEVMASRYPTPRDLVAALHERGKGAREQLQEFLRAPLARLMDDLRQRYRLSRRAESLTHHALHAAETHLRTQASAAFASMTWSAFRAAILLHVAKLASLPYGERPGSIRSPQALPRSLSYDSEAFFQPHERVGDYWFGGDWFGGVEAADGSLWVLIADVTGHGYFAYLMACTLPSVWRACWESAPSAPAELLGSMHDLLADCLPEGVYVECTLVRVHPEGEVIAVPAGGSRLLLRRGSDRRPALLKLRGSWLGLARPSAGDQAVWNLDDGDELLLATDGMYDQIHQFYQQEVADAVGTITGTAGLFEQVRDLLRQALEKTPQKDDITMVFLRRRCRDTEFLALAPPQETGDVPV
jgi:serine phosphatase RsbU (regulator of sigma subunit)